MRVLFFNEGNFGSHIMGQGQLDAALHTGAQERPEIELRFAGLPPIGRFANAAIYHRLGPLSDRRLDFPTLRWHLVQSARARRALRATLAEWPADVVQLHTQSISLLMGGLLRRRHVALSVDTTIDDWWSMPAWASSNREAEPSIAPSVALERYAFTRARLVLAWTAWAARAVAATAPKANVVEHHPGIDLTRYRPASRRERTRMRVLFVGGRFIEKGGEDLLAALGEQLGSNVELDLVTPAEVPERDGVRVHRLSASDPQLLDLQQQADLFCLPTHGDAAPWAVLESMACGTPVISTHIGGIPDLLDRGRAGVLVPHGDLRELGDALRALLQNPQRRAQLAAAARERCEREYDARRQFGRLVQRLSAIVPQGARGPCR
ncbi:MAG: glycosyltransferase family 4 protein [Solirubrobacteraceae bacterium]